LYPDTLSGAGHVGWAYTVPTVMDAFNRAVGDTDTPWLVGSFGAAFPSAFTSPGSSTSHVQTRAADAAADFAQQYYTEWKGLMSGDGNYEEAYLVAREAELEPYLLVTNNCMDVTDRILRAFGVEVLPGLPQTWPTLTPADYFKSINHPSTTIGVPGGGGAPSSEVVHVHPSGRAQARLGALAAKPIAQMTEAIDALKQAYTAGPAGSTGSAATDPLAKAITRIVEDFRKRGGAITVDGDDALAPGADGSELVRALRGANDASLVKQFRAKASEATRESDWRKGVNGGPLQSEKMPIHPVLALSLARAWVDVDYRSCGRKGCCRA
jgi:hypothetical protein